MAMQQSQLSGLEIINLQQVLNHMSALDTRNPVVIAAIRKEMRKPFSDIRKKAKRNLQVLMSGSPVSKGNLEKGLSVRTRVRKNRGYFSVAFGGRTIPARKGRNGKGANHFHLINSGTSIRRTKRGYNRGAVGKRKIITNLTNLKFKTGFATRAAQSERNNVVPTVAKGIADVYKRIKTPGT